MLKPFAIVLWSIMWLLAETSFAQAPAPDRRLGLPLNEEQQLNRETLQLAERLRSAPAGEKEKLKAELRALIEKHFEVRQNGRKQEIDALAERILNLKTAFQKRQDSKVEIVGRRLADLLDEDKDLRWDEALAPPTTPTRPGNTPSVKPVTGPPSGVPGLGASAAAPGTSPYSLPADAGPDPRPKAAASATNARQQLKGTWRVVEDSGTDPMVRQNVILRMVFQGNQAWFEVARPENQAREIHKRYGVVLHPGQPARMDLQEDTTVRCIYEVRGDQLSIALGTPQAYPTSFNGGSLNGVVRTMRLTRESSSPPIRVIELWRAFRQAENLTNEAQDEYNQIKNRAGAEQQKAASQAKLEQAINQSLQALKQLTDYTAQLPKMLLEAQDRLKRAEPELRTALEAELSAITKGTQPPPATLTTELKAAIAQARDQLLEITSAIEITNSVGRLPTQLATVKIQIVEPPQAERQPTTTVILGTVVPGLNDEVLILTCASSVSPPKAGIVEVDLLPATTASTTSAPAAISGKAPTRLPAQVIARDEKNDLALLRVEGHAVRPFPAYVASLGTVSWGQRVAAAAPGWTGLMPLLVTAAGNPETTQVSVGSIGVTPGSGVFATNGDLIGVVPSPSTGRDPQTIIGLSPILELFAQAKRPSPIHPDRNYASIDFTGEWHVTLPAGFEFRSQIEKQPDGGWQFKDMRTLSGKYRLAGDRLNVEAPIDARLTEFGWAILNPDVLALKYSPDVSKVGSDYRGTIAQRITKEGKQAGDGTVGAWRKVLAEKPSDAVLLIELLPNNQYAVFGQPVANQGMLNAILNSYAQRHRQVTVAIAASRDVPFKQVQEVIDSCKQFELNTISITVSNPETPTTPEPKSPVTPTPGPTTPQPATPAPVVPGLEAPRGMKP